MVDDLGGYEVSVAVFAMKPASRGSVRLNASDPRAPLHIDHGFLSHPDDASVLVEGVERLRQIAAADRSAGMPAARRAPVRRSTR